MYMKVKIPGLNSVMTLLLVNVKHILYSIVLDLFIRTVFMTIPHALVSTVDSFHTIFLNSYVLSTHFRL
jgi:predicted branched-subunit amino acid permease